MKWMFVALWVISALMFLTTMVLCVIRLQRGQSRESSENQALATLSVVGVCFFAWSAAIAAGSPFAIHLAVNAGPGCLGGILGGNFPRLWTRQLPIWKRIGPSLVAAVATAALIFSLWSGRREDRRYLALGALSAIPVTAGVAALFGSDKPSSVAHEDPGY